MTYANKFKWTMLFIFSSGVAIIRVSPDSSSPKLSFLLDVLGFWMCITAVFLWLEFCFRDLKNTLIAEIRKTHPTN